MSPTMVGRQKNFWEFWKALKTADWRSKISDKKI